MTSHPGGIDAFSGAQDQGLGTTALDKGKGKAKDDDIHSLLQDALSTPLIPPPRQPTPFLHHPIPPPPRAVISPTRPSTSHSPSPSLSPPKLLSQVTRPTLPVSRLSHTSLTASTLGIGLSSHPSPSAVHPPETPLLRGSRRKLVLQVQQDLGDIDRTDGDVMERGRSLDLPRPSGGGFFQDISIPKLPFTASIPTFSNPFASKPSLPDMRSRKRSMSIDSDSPQLQRTITSLLTHPPRSTSTSHLPPSGPNKPSFPLSLNLSLPSLALPNLPRMSSPFSTSATSELGWKEWWDGPGGEMNKPDGKARDKASGMLSVEDQGESREEEQAKIERKYQSPKNPIVFCHGLLGFDYLGPASLPPLQISHWRGIREVLEENGTEVMITRVPATSSVEDRAKILQKTIEERYEGREVNIIGHSMGGLDARWLISRIPDKKFKIVSLTTVATPHKGSPFADYCIDNIIGRENMPLWLSLLDILKLPNQGDGSAFESLHTVTMKTFNEEVPDDPEVKYYSWGATFDPGLLDTFRWPHGIIEAKEGPNDGMVSVHSAQHGQYMGTLQGVNHLDLVGWVNHIRYALSSWSGHEISFKPATFYLEVADKLAKDGF